MKKVLGYRKLLLFIILSCLCLTDTFAYNPTLKDEQVLKRAFVSIDRIISRSIPQAKKIDRLIGKYQKKYSTNERVSYLLDELHNYIQQELNQTDIIDISEETDIDKGADVPTKKWDISDFKHVYEVGPNKEYKDVSEVPWATLEKSSIILIDWKDSPYYGKFVVNVAATKAEPVVVTGVANSRGELPMISGKGAKTSLLLNYWNERKSIIKIGGSSKPSNEMPSYIYIENLDISGANPSNSFIDDSGNSDTYTKNAAGIHIEYGDHITIKNCKIHDNGNGLFSSHFTTNILISGNYIYDNGIVGSIYHHNTYTESNGITYEYNRFGKLKIGAKGNNLKDRSANIIVRYNWIEGGNRQIDLVESSYQEFVNAPNYHRSYVYGNILIEHEEDGGNSQFMHYGGDGGDISMYRNGTLYLYNNTFVSYRDHNPTIIRMALNSAKAEMINNIFFVKNGKSLAISSGRGQFVLQNNFLPLKWINTFEEIFNGKMTQANNILGTDPGFMDFNNKKLQLNGDSVNKNAALSLDQKSEFYPIDYSYKTHQSQAIRNSVQSIGAFE